MGLRGARCPCARWGEAAERGGGPRQRARGAGGAARGASARQSRRGLAFLRALTGEGSTAGLLEKLLADVGFLACDACGCLYALLLRACWRPGCERGFLIRAVSCVTSLKQALSPSGSLAVNTRGEGGKGESRALFVQTELCLAAENGLCHLACWFVKDGLGGSSHGKVCC